MFLQYEWTSWHTANGLGQSKAHAIMTNRHGVIDNDTLCGLTVPPGRSIAMWNNDYCQRCEVSANKQQIRVTD